MRLIVECEHGLSVPHMAWPDHVQCLPQSTTDPAVILATLAEAGVLKVEADERMLGSLFQWRYVSPWVVSE